MKTSFSFAVTGAINSGKSTLARRLAEELGAVLLSSDDIRAGLSNRQRGRGALVFARMNEWLEAAFAHGEPVVLDSTGMSPRFRAILRMHRASLYHIHLHLENLERFVERERTRSDRPGRKRMAREAFFQSRRVVFYDPPDLTIATDALTPGQVYELAAKSSPSKG